MPRHRRRRRRCRASVALQAAYGRRARTLEEAILSLTPRRPSSSSPPSGCRCRGVDRCLACARRAFLLRPGDSPEYISLMTKGLCVVTSDARPPPVELHPDDGLSQRKIVVNTIELILDEGGASSNVLCNGYTKLQCSHPSIELLCTPAWDVLLSRIGCPVMVYLLRCLSIFVPLQDGRHHHQVTGLSMQTLCEGGLVSSAPTEHAKQQHGRTECREECSPKRMRVGDGGLLAISYSYTRQCHRSLVNDDPEEKNNAFVNRQAKLPLKEQCNEQGDGINRSVLFSKSREMNLPEVPIASFLHGQHSATSSCAYDNSRKRVRPLNWWQHGKQKRACLSREDVSNNGNPKKNTTLTEGMRVSMGSKSGGGMDAPICFSCLVLQASKKVDSGDHITKRQIFYSTDAVSSVFPKYHILNRVKANDIGAISLMEHIFVPHNGISDLHKLIRGDGYCTVESKCSFYSVLALLKSLIRRAKRCPYKSLLQRHCPCSMLEECCNVKFKSMPQREEMHGETFQFSNQRLVLLDSYCTHHQIVSFIWAVIRRIVPLDCLGDTSTWRVLRKKIWNFVRLHKLESLCLQECFQGLEASRFPFVCKLCPVDCIRSYESMHELGTDQYADTRPKITHNAKTTLCNKLLQCWIYWFFSQLVVPLIKSHFYVTENASKNQEVFYYHKAVWESLVSSSIICLKDQFEGLDDASMRAAIKDGSFCFSKGRLLLKSRDFRLVANLSAPCKVELCSKKYASGNCIVVSKGSDQMRQKQFKMDQETPVRWFKSVNSILTDLSYVLGRIKFEDPHKLGASVFDYNDVHKKMLCFLSEVKKCPEILHNIYIVVADVSKAFDSIDQNLLISIMKNVIDKDMYPMRRYTRIDCNKSSLALARHQMPFHGVCNIDFKELTPCMRVASSNNILIDQGSLNFINGHDLHCLLSKILKGNILRLGGNFYLQKIGIPQGSSVSPLLCSFYYGHLERNIIFPSLEIRTGQVSAVSDESTLLDSVLDSNIHKCAESTDKVNTLLSIRDDTSQFEQLCASNLGAGKTLLSDESHVSTMSSNYFETEDSRRFLFMRLIDDFLFISTSKMQATLFYDKIRRGFRKYNCFMNNGKFGFNFDVMQDRINDSRVYVGADGVSFLHWSGLLLNCRTLEVQADYTRYINSHMRSCITIPKNGKTVDALQGRLCDYVKPRCHPIFYDNNINSAATVRLNVYQSFLLTAMKFHCYVRGSRIVNCFSSCQFLDIIKQSVSFGHDLIKKRTSNMESRFVICPVLHLREPEVIWLGLRAYVRVLRKKQSQYKELISLLDAKISCYAHVAAGSDDLNYAVDDTHSSAFWKIKF